MRGCCAKRGQRPDVDVPDMLSPARTTPEARSALSQPLTERSQLSKSQTLMVDIRQAQPAQNKISAAQLATFPFTKRICAVSKYVGADSWQQDYVRVQPRTEPSILLVTSPKKKSLPLLQISDDQEPQPNKTRVIKTPKPQKPEDKPLRASSLRNSMKNKDFIQLNVSNIKKGNYLLRTPIRKKKPELLWNVKDGEQEKQYPFDINAELALLKQEDTRPPVSPMGSQTEQTQQSKQPIRQKQPKRVVPERAPEQVADEVCLGDLKLSSAFNQQPIRDLLEKKKLFVALDDDLQVLHEE